MACLTTFCCYAQTVPIVLGLCGDCEAVPPLVLSHYLVAVLQFMPNHEGDRQLHSSVSLLAQMVAQGSDKFVLDIDIDIIIQGDTSRCSLGSVDMKTKVVLYTGWPITSRTWVGLT